MNKMVMAVVQRDLTELILHELLNAGFTATFNESKGGMLRQSQHSLYIAVAENQLQDVLKIIKGVCHKRKESNQIPEFQEQIESFSDEINIADAIVFVWDLNGIERY